MNLGTSYVSVDIDREEILDDLSDEQLLKYAERRLAHKIIVNDDDAFKALVNEAYDYLIMGDIPMSKLRLEQALFPRYTSPDECRNAYKKLIADKGKTP